MERSLIKQVNRKGVGARLSSRKVKPVFFPNFFGVKRKDSLKRETLTGKKSVPAIADVISFDSSAPQKKHEVVGKVSGDIPRTAVKRGMNENDWNEYRQPSRDCGGNSDLKSILDLAFKDQDFVYNTVRGRLEWWCIQLISKGGFILNSSNNNGIVTEEFVGCGMRNENKKVSTADRANANTTDGLQDIEDIVVSASTDSITIKYVVMRKDRFTLLKKQKAVIEKVKGWIDQKERLTISKKVINEYLSAQESAEGVQIVLMDPAIRIGDAPHNRTTISPWEATNICFLEDLQCGDIQHGPIATEHPIEYKKKAATLKKDFVFISKWSELEPFKEWVRAETNTIPVVNDPDAMYIMRTDAKEWAADEDTEKAGEE